MTKSSDPTAGETVYRLTNSRRSEPERSLFQVPAGYAVQEAGAMFLKTLKVSK